MISVREEWNDPCLISFNDERNDLYCDLLMMSGKILTVISFNDEWNDPFCDICYETDADEDYIEREHKMN